jgi:hypothetical protein
MTTQHNRPMSAWLGTSSWKTIFLAHCHLLVSPRWVPDGGWVGTGLTVEPAIGQLLAGGGRLRLDRRRLCGFGRKTHSQLSGSKSPSLKTRSNRTPSPRGFSPMSERNASNDNVHRKQTRMPLPPYQRNFEAFGFSHLDRMERHAV